jgi:hypothetical protein
VVGRSAFDDHRHAKPGAERDERPRFNLVSRHEVKTKSLCECCHDQLRLDQREMVADTLARPGAKRDVHEFRSIRAPFRQEPIGIELVRVLPEGRESMQHVRDDKREPSTGQMKPAELIIRKRLPRETPRRRV